MYYSSILVSVTEICTVGCRHCGFTGAVRERQPERAEIDRWVTEACDFGIPRIIFTGGEPFQRFQLLKAGFAAVARHEKAPPAGVFTSSFWGKDPATVDKILDQLDGLDQFYLSTDIFHQEQVPAQYVVNVIEGAIRHGVPNISLCITVAEDWEEKAIRDSYRRFEDRVMVHVDKVITSPHIDTATPPGNPPEPQHFKPRCYLQTPIINPNGDLCACHAGKVGAHMPLRDNVYFLGNLKEQSFADIMAAKEADYEYQFLRAYGPQGVARLVGDSDSLRERIGGRTYTNGCDLCTKVLLTPRGKTALREAVADPFQRALIDTVRETRLGEAPAGQR